MEGGGTMSEGPVVRVVEVTKRFGDITAVDRVTFDVGRSEFFSLLGPSGCGKTTTLRMLAGFERPTEGSILLEGEDAAGVPPYRRNTNMVFQNYALFPHLTVAQNIAFGPERKRLSRKEVQERVSVALETIRLTELSARYPKELSGGQQQRVALARALANRPAVLLLDEPLGALDLKLREEMQFELKRIQREVGISFVYVTHDQGEAMTMSDRIAVMHAGRVEHLGTPEEIYLQPASLFVAGFIGKAGLLPCTVEDVTPTRLTVGLPDGGRAEASRGPHEYRPGLEAVLVVRPEHLSLSLEPPGAGSSSLAVRVVDEVFLGAAIRYLVEGPDGVQLWVLTAYEARLPAGSPGRSAWVRWDPARAYVLPVERGSAPGEGEAPEAANGRLSTLSSGDA